VDEVVGGQALTRIARRLDRTGGEELGGFRAEGQQAGDGGAVDAALVAERHAGVAEQVEPGDGGRASEEGLESVAVEVVDGGGQDGLLVEHVFASALLEQAGELRGREVALRGADAQV